MNNFVNYKDSLSNIINEQANILYNQFFNLPINQLNLPESPKEYFIGKHHQRKFFSVQTAAEILYRSLKLKNKPPEDTVIMDYGGGLGSLYLLAKMIGCKKVIYNDIREDMREAAIIIANYFKIDIDFFIVGNYEETYKQLEVEKIKCDIIASRNVMEHIYNLYDYFQVTAEYQPDALIYSSTTANYSNPLMRIRHFKIHKEYEAEYFIKRTKMIKDSLPDLNPEELQILAKSMRGLAMDDFYKSIENYKNDKTLPDPNQFYTNTCDPENGLWAENMLKIKDYKDIFRKSNYKFQITPGFWDTHYAKLHMRLLGKTMNFIGRISNPRFGLKTTAFIYIIAYKSKLD